MPITPDNGDSHHNLEIHMAISMQYNKFLNFEVMVTVTVIIECPSGDRTSR